MEDATEPTPVTFIIRLMRADDGRVSGIVERVRTGEKRRFHGLDAIGTVIGSCLEDEAGRVSPER
jgi:hypothetical protein